MTAWLATVIDLKKNPHVWFMIILGSTEQAWKIGISFRRENACVCRSILKSFFKTLAQLALSKILGDFYLLIFAYLGDLN